MWQRTSPEMKALVPVPESAYQTLGQCTLSSSLFLGAAPHVNVGNVREGKRTRLVCLSCHQIHLYAYSATLIGSMNVPAHGSVVLFDFLFLEKFSLPYLETKAL